MRKLLLGISLLTSVSALATSAFTVSGSKIQEIFKSEQVWRKVGGPIDSIQFKGHKDDVSTFWITVQQGPCLLVVDITNTTPDELNPKWEVTKVDSTACPGALKH